MAGLNMGPQQQKWVAVGLGVAVALAAWVNFFLMPQLHLRSQMVPELGRLEKRVVRSRQNVTNLPGVEEELSRLLEKSDLATESTKSPEEQLPELLDMIAQAARSNNVRLVTVRPGTDIKTLAPAESGYLELPLRIEAVANYHHLGKFLDAVENSRELVRLQSLRIRGDSSDIWNHKASLILLAYVLPGKEKTSP